MTPEQTALAAAERLEQELAMHWNQNPGFADYTPDGEAWLEAELRLHWDARPAHALATFPRLLHEYESVLAVLRAALGQAQEREKKLRALLWLRHGCEHSALYGDDGEQQCGRCILDFKRDEPAQIENRWHQLAMQKLAALRAPAPEPKP